MLSISWLFLCVLALAYANGANDNFKGVATLYGSGIVHVPESFGLVHDHDCSRKSGQCLDFRGAGFKVQREKPGSG